MLVGVVSPSALAYFIDGPAKLGYGGMDVLVLSRYILTRLFCSLGQFHCGMDLLWTQQGLWWHWVSHKDSMCA